MLTQWKDSKTIELAQRNLQIEELICQSQATTTEFSRQSSGFKANLKQSNTIAC